MNFTNSSNFKSRLALGILLSLSLSACCSDGKLPDIVAGAQQQPPVAVLIARPARAVVEISEITGMNPFEVNLDASDSFDIDGEITQYDWDYDSDGTYDLIDGASIVPHTFSPDNSDIPGSTVSATEVPVGTYTTTVRVFDNDGLSNTAAAIINVNDFEFVPPTAVASAMVDTSDPLLVHFDGSASFDIDGTIEQYDWDMDNDGAFELVDAGPTPDQTFNSFGLHTVGLQVTDDDSLTDTTTIDVTLTEVPNIPPVADVVPTPALGDAPGLNVEFDASASFDTDGVIIRYDWDMDNDGTFEIVDGGVTQPATYDTGGIYAVGVKVTDDDSATDTATTSVDVNNPPTANLVPVPASGRLPDLQVTWDASGSTDSDGTITQYDWDMDNDGVFEILAGGSDRSVTYNTAGTVTIGVQVTDDDGATDRTTADVVISLELIPPVANVIALPASGTLMPGSPGPEFSGSYDASASSDSDGTIVRYDWDMDNDGSFEITNGGDTQPFTYDASGIYTVGVRVTDNDDLTDTDSASVDVNEPPVAVVTPDPVFGHAPVSVDWDASASFDNDGTIIRYDWDMDNDGTFEVSDGGVTQSANYDTSGFKTVGVRVTDDDNATDSATTSMEVNSPPVAIITADPAFGDAPDLPVQFDASTSFDTDGTVVRYDWDMDDDGTFEIQDGSVTQNELFAAAGLYEVWVQVTDDDGATDINSVIVDVNNPPIADVVPSIPAWDGSEWDVVWDASGSTDSDGSIVRYDWDMDNDSVYEITNGGSTQPASYTIDATYTVRVRVWDDDGAQDSDSAGVLILTPPTAVLIGTDIGDACIDWDASGSFDPNGTIDRYDWDMDNNGTFELQDDFDSQFECYQGSGTYTVGVQVTDNDGNTDTAYFSVTIP